jgi:hypothetical protein
MTTVEKISQHTRNLPGIYQAEVLDFVEYLENKVRIKTGDESQIEEQQRFEDHEGENTRFFLQEMPKDFWQSPSLEELAVSQGVKSMPDVNVIVGTWPGSLRARQKLQASAMAL